MKNQEFIADCTVSVYQDLTKSTFALVVRWARMGNCLASDWPRAFGF